MEEDNNQKNQNKNSQLEDFINKWDELPESIQKTLISEERADYFLELEKNYNLTIEQTDILVKTTNDVLLLRLPYQAFVDILIGRLIDAGIHPIIAKEIAQKIESKYLFPIKEELLRIYYRFSARKKLEKEEKEENKEIISPPSETKELKEEKEAIINKEMPEPSSSLTQPNSKSFSKRPFLSFFRFKKSAPSQQDFSSNQPIIIGREEELKPILEEKSPWVISFEDVKPAREQIISEVETSADGNLKLTKQKETTPIREEAIPITEENKEGKTEISPFAPFIITTEQKSTEISEPLSEKDLKQPEEREEEKKGNGLVEKNLKGPIEAEKLLEELPSEEKLEIQPSSSDNLSFQESPTASEIKIPLVKMSPQELEQSPLSKTLTSQSPLSQTPDFEIKPIISRKEEESTSQETEIDKLEDEPSSLKETEKETEEKEISWTNSKEQEGSPSKLEEKRGDSEIIDLSKLKF